VHSDRYTKVVLTLIALGLWALTMAQIGMPSAGATQPIRPYAEPTHPFSAAGSAEGSQQGVMQPGESADAAPAESRGPTSTLPLRWRLSWAAQETGGEFTWCSTAAVVTNTSPVSVAVEVEWMNGDGSPLALVAVSLNAGESLPFPIFQTGNDERERVNSNPWAHPVAKIAFIGDFRGYGLVTADDPRIMVSAFQYCRTGLGDTGATIVSQTNIPAYPVGATAEYFRADVPAAWTPPLSETRAP
jgi:hypothetical protein